MRIVWRIQRDVPVGGPYGPTAGDGPIVMPCAILKLATGFFVRRALVAGSNGIRFSGQLESLILAQDERWRQA